MSNSKLRGLMALPMIGLAVLGLTACSGGGRPSVDDIKNAMTDGSNAEDYGVDNETYNNVMDCAANGLHDSDLSDESLNKIVHGTKDDMDKLTDEEMQVLTEVVSKCSTENM